MYLAKTKVQKLKYIIYDKYIENTYFQKFMKNTRDIHEYFNEIHEKYII